MAGRHDCRGRIPVAVSGDCVTRRSPARGEARNGPFCRITCVQAESPERGTSSIPKSRSPSNDRSSRAPSNNGGRAPNAARAPNRIGDRAPSRSVARVPNRSVRRALTRSASLHFDRGPPRDRPQSPTEQRRRLADLRRTPWTTRVAWRTPARSWTNRAEPRGRTSRPTEPPRPWRQTVFAAWWLLPNRRRRFRRRVGELRWAASSLGERSSGDFPREASAGRPIPRATAQEALRPPGNSTTSLDDLASPIISAMRSLRRRRLAAERRRHGAHICSSRSSCDGR